MSLPMSQEAPWAAAPIPTFPKTRCQLECAMRSPMTTPRTWLRRTDTSLPRQQAHKVGLRSPKRGLGSA